MRLVLSSPGFFPQMYGGGQQYVLVLAKELIRRGHSVVVLNWNTRSAQQEKFTVTESAFQGVRVVNFGMRADALPPSDRAVGGGGAALALLEPVVRALAPDVAHLNDASPLLTGACHRLGIPIVVTAHHTGMACPAGDLLRPGGAVCHLAMSPGPCVPCCLKRRTEGKPAARALSALPAWAYRPLGRALDKVDPHNIVGRGLQFPWLVERKIEASRQVLEAADIIVTPSRFMVDLLVRNGVPGERILLERHGVIAHAPQPIPALAGRRVRFGYVGRIAPDKGLHLVFDALRLLGELAARVELVIVGAPRGADAERYLEELLESYQGPAATIQRGFVEPSRMADQYASIDILVVPSIVPEAFGLTVAEAFSVGRPVIVSKSGALPELVRDGIDGFVVGRNDSHVLAERMHSLILNPSSILALADAAPPVRSIEDYADAIERVYDSVMAKGEPAAAHL